MPFTYYEDRGGTRNADLYVDRFFAQRQARIQPFIGHERLLDRAPFPEMIGEIDKHGHILNEVMFDLSLAGQYIDKIVVSSHTDKNEE